MTNKLYRQMNWPKIEDIIYSESDNPHELLGPHKCGGQTLVQAYFPQAKEAEIVFEQSGETVEMSLADEDGYFAAFLPGTGQPAYHYKVTESDGTERIRGEAYRFKPLITREDTEKFNNGIHYTVYEKLGAHPMTLEGVEGTYFAVWAPGVKRASVVGDFNSWDGRVHQMRRLWDSGIFELFVPEAKVGDNYKFELKTPGGNVFLKADPYGNAAQLRPDTASVITDLEGFAWEDKAFIENREEFQAGNAPVSVYEMYLGSFMKAGEDEPYANYREIADRLIPYIKEMGYTHVELMPVMEHPFDGSWGYQVIGYYAPTARYGSPKDFMYFVNELHKAGIGVILDWVPAHFPRDVYGLSNFDGTCLYEHQDPRQGSHPHWGTLIYNYGRPEVANYLIANALFWVEKYHVDGIRMDAVASMLYLDYGKKDGEWVANMYGGKENLEAIGLIKHINSVLHKRNRGVLSIAEESTAFPRITGSLEEDGLGFDYKWNMGFMNDYLQYIKYDPYFRAHHHGELTFSMIYAYSEKFMLVFSHDEVVHGKATMLGKMPGEMAQKLANLRLTYAYMMTHPGKKLLFMGQELGELDEWNENRCVEWELGEVPEHRGLSLLVKELNRLYRTRQELYLKDGMPEGFEWINNISAQDCYLTYVRHGEKEDDVLLVAANFAGVGKELTTGVPFHGKYREILNTDDVRYGGSGIVNEGTVKSRRTEWDDRPQSVTVELAPLSLSILEYIPFTREELLKEAEDAAGERVKAEEAAREAAVERAAAEKAIKAAEAARIKAEETLRSAAESEARARAAAAAATEREKAEKEKAALHAEEERFAWEAAGKAEGPAREKHTRKAEKAAGAENGADSAEPVENAGAKTEKQVPLKKAEKAASEQKKPAQKSGKGDRK